MSLSKVEVGYQLKSSKFAKPIITKLNRVAKKEGRLGSYEVANNAEGVTIMHVLTPEEETAMVARCATKPHQIHVDGHCVVCHAQGVKN